MEKKYIISQKDISPKRAILEKIISISKRTMKEENDCFQQEREINYCALAQGLLKKYEELVNYYPNNSSSDFSFLKEIRKEIDNIEHLKKPHNSLKIISYLSEILLNKEE